MPNSSGYFRFDCRLCRKRNLERFLDFGLQPHSDGFVAEKNLSKPDLMFPLGVALCTDCGHAQLTYVVRPEVMWDQEYVYDASITQTGRTHFFEMSKSIVETYAVPQNSLVIDIGSNVGLLLSGFKEQGMRVLGIDPAPQPVAIARERGIDSELALFSSTVARKVADEKGKARVITGTNVFAHMDDLDDIMKGIDTLLEDEGIFVIEAPYMVDLVEHLEYDTIYHQHLSYLSIRPLIPFFRRFGMELFDVVRTSIHGGSIRLFVGRKGTKTVQPVVEELARAEEAIRLHTPEYMHAFAGRVAKHRNELISLLMTLKDQGKSIAGIAAPAKGNTLLNYCGINGSILDFITEKNQLKVGRYTPATRIPILPDAALLERMPSHAVVLAWNFGEEIMRNQKAYADKGGKFILPIPAPVIR